MIKRSGKICLVTIPGRIIGKPGILSRAQPDGIPQYVIDEGMGSCRRMSEARWVEVVVLAGRAAGRRICAASRMRIRNNWVKGPGTAGAEGVEGRAGTSEGGISMQVEGYQERQARRSRPEPLRKPKRRGGVRRLCGRRQRGA